MFFFFLIFDVKLFDILTIAPHAETSYQIFSMILSIAMDCPGWNHSVDASIGFESKNKKKSSF